MRNHVHVSISFTETNQKINTVVGNGKRFMAYEIITRLKQNNESELLTLLSDHVKKTKRK